MRSPFLVTLFFTLVFFVTFLTHSCKKDSLDDRFKVGVIDQSVYYHKLDPHVYLYGEPNYYDSLLIDFERDGETDIVIGFNIYYTVEIIGVDENGNPTSEWIDTRYSWIKAYNNIEINADPDKHYVCNFEQNDIILPTDENWVAPEISLYITGFSFTDLFSEEPSTGLFPEELSIMNNIDNPNTYIVFRIPENSLMKYGWIKINPKKTVGIEVFEFALQH